MYASLSNRRESGANTRPHFLQLLCPGFFQGDYRWSVSDSWFVTLDYFPLLYCRFLPYADEAQVLSFRKRLLAVFRRSGTLLTKEISHRPFSRSQREISIRRHPDTAGWNPKERSLSQEY